MRQNVVLFVEDNADFRDSAARFLELSDYKVVVASDGVEALEILDKSNLLPDVIISDISMPNMNGYQFFEAVRERPEMTGVPFIFLTALDARDDFKLGWDVGVDEYLVKPFRPEDFLSVIRNRINRNREIQEMAAKQLDLTRNMIVRILSHELRTPLTYVTGGFTLLADEINKEQAEDISINRLEIQTILHLIHSGTERLNRLAEQMVMLAELTSTKSSHTWAGMIAPIHMNEVIETACANLQNLADENQVQIEINVADVLMNGISNLLIAAIAEPLRNAIKFSEQGQTVWVEANVDPEDEGFIIIDIRDEGRGIKAEDLENIWEIMQQSEREVYEHQGLGLGLPITQQIVKLHQGTANIQSSPDQGTVVTLRLPLHLEVAES